MKDSTVTYEAAHVVYVRPDAAAVKVRQRPVTLDGRPIEEENEGSPSTSWPRRTGSGGSSRRQNTVVLDT